MWDAGPVARITTTTQQLYEALRAKGAWAGTAGQLQQAIEARLGPLPEDADPVGHWRAVDSLRSGQSGRLPPFDEVAIDLAEAGHPCLGLVGAVRMIVAATDPDRDPEDVAEELMGLRSDGSDSPYGVHLARRMRAGGTPRPGTEGEDARLEALGQAQAVAAEMAEVANGASPTASLDPDDMAQVFGLPSELVRAFIPAFAAIFGPTGVLGNVDRLVEGVTPAALAVAIRGAAGLVPLYEQIVGPLGSRSNRRRWIAAVAPLLLSVGDLCGAYLSNVGGVDAARAIPSMFDPASPALARAESALLAFLAPAGSHVSAGNDGAADVG